MSLILGQAGTDEGKEIEGCEKADEWMGTEESKEGRVGDKETGKKMETKKRAEYGWQCKSTNEEQNKWMKLNGYVHLASICIPLCIL